MKYLVTPIQNMKFRILNMDFRLQMGTEELALIER